MLLEKIGLLWVLLKAELKAKTSLWEVYLWMWYHKAEVKNIDVKQGMN